MSFEEARPAIISDYQTFLEKNWVDQLKRRYSVKMNEKGKQYILQQLQVQGVESPSTGFLLVIIGTFLSGCDLIKMKVKMGKEMNKDSRCSPRK